MRYLLRSALSLKRLSLREDGAAVYRLQRPDRRGRTALVMAPLEFMARLAAILPAPRLALRRQLGVFSPGSPDRRKVMPTPAPPESCHPAAKSAPARLPWAELLRRVWHIDALRCDRCGGRLRPVALVQDLAEAACGGAGNGSDGGPTTSQCSETASQLCQKASSCSTGHDGGFTVIITSADADAGIHSDAFTINGDESDCDNFFLDATCAGSHSAAFTAACGPAIGGLQCGTDSMFGGGVVLPSPCSQDF